MASAGSAGRPGSFPRGALLGAAALVGFALLAAAAARVGGLGTSSIPVAEAVQSRELRFEDRSDGAVAVYDGREDRMVALLPPGTNGFVRGVMRGLARERRQREVDARPPFRLTRWSDGRVSLEDTGTGRRIELEAFGPTNLGAFARLLDSGAGAAP